jgi:sirohydrochlorin ferrochelatase
VSQLNEITCFLFDNGSFRPEATLSLRALAKKLEANVGMKVRPVSLLHSTRIAPESLDGMPAELLESALVTFAESGGTQVILLPLFFGPSGALVDYLPERIDTIQARFPALCLCLADCLVNLVDDSAAIVAQALTQRIADQIHRHPEVCDEALWVISTDHGSPKPAVTNVRNRIGSELSEIWAAKSTPVIVASMEKREGAEYVFNDPLLAMALEEAVSKGARSIIVAQQFLQAGRHAGEGGDIAEICDVAQLKHPQVLIYQTQVLADTPEIELLLRRRFEAAIKAST